MSPQPLGRPGARGTIPRSPMPKPLEPTAKQRLNAPFLLALCLVGVVVPSLMLFGGLNRSQPDQASVLATVVPNVTSSVKPSETTASTAASPTVVPMNQTLTNQIHMGQIDRIAVIRGVRSIIFRDGSQLSVDDYTLSQLPRDIQLRLTYKRGPK